MGVVCVSLFSLACVMLHRRVECLIAVWTNYAHAHHRSRINIALHPLFSRCLLRFSSGTTPHSPEYLQTGTNEGLSYATDSFQIGDRLLEVNGLNVELLSLAVVSTLLLQCFGVVVVTVSRPVSNHSAPTSVTATSGSIAVARGCGSVTQPQPPPRMRSVGSARNVTVHRHPNSGSMHLMVDTAAVRRGHFPGIGFDAYPQSPDAPLVEGGVLHQQVRLLLACLLFLSAVVILVLSSALTVVCLDGGLWVVRTNTRTHAYTHARVRLPTHLPFAIDDDYCHQRMSCWRWMGCTSSSLFLLYEG
jgi:hypothetical protein